MGALDGRVAIVTGAGRGIGREHARFFAAEGAKVVVNDLGGAMDGSGPTRLARRRGGRGDPGVGWRGHRQRRERRRLGWRAASGRGGDRGFGDLHILVNNAGILRDRVLVNMTEDEWDSVVKVHLKGHFVPTRHAAAWWRQQAKQGRDLSASVINTSSTSGLLGNPGQANYGAAKAGIAAFTVIMRAGALALRRPGERHRASSRTRMTESTPGLSDIVGPRRTSRRSTSGTPPTCRLSSHTLPPSRALLTGKVFFIQGGRVRLFQPWTMTDGLESAGRWTVEDLARELPGISV